MFNKNAENLWLWHPEKKFLTILLTTDLKDNCIAS
jgi:hypothetical protein